MEHPEFVETWCILCGLLKTFPNSVALKQVSSYSTVLSEMLSDVRGSALTRYLQELRTVPMAAEVATMRQKELLVQWETIRNMDHHANHNKIIQTMPVFKGMVTTFLDGLRNREYIPSVKAELHAERSIYTDQQLERVREYNHTLGKAKVSLDDDTTTVDFAHQYVDALDDGDKKDFLNTMVETMCDTRKGIYEPVMIDNSINSSSAMLAHLQRFFLLSDAISSTTIRNSLT